MSNYSSASSVKDLSEDTRNSRLLHARRYIPTGTFTEGAVAGKLSFLRSFRHENLVSVIQIFHREDMGIIEAALEFMPVVVVDLCVRAFPFHDEVSLAAILGQVIRGLSFLDNAGFTHMEFTESCVMADLEGTVKIGNLDWCDKGKMLPVQLLALTQHLMYPWLYFEPIRRDEKKWPRDSHAVEFWLALQRPKTSLLELSESALLRLPWQISHVKNLIMLAFDDGRTHAMTDRPWEKGCLDRRLTMWIHSLDNGDTRNSDALRGKFRVLLTSTTLPKALSHGVIALASLFPQALPHFSA